MMPKLLVVNSRTKNILIVNVFFQISSDVKTSSISIHLHYLSNTYCVFLCLFHLPLQYSNRFDPAKCLYLERSNMQLNLVNTGAGWELWSKWGFLSSICNILQPLLSSQPMIGPNINGQIFLCWLDQFLLFQRTFLMFLAFWLVVTCHDSSTVTKVMHKLTCISLKKIRVVLKTS